MVVALFVLLVVNLIVPSDAQGLSCFLADKEKKTVWSIGVTIPAGVYAEYRGDRPISDVCVGEDIFFAAGAEADPSTGGYIAAVEITGIQEVVALFSAECSTIECDTSAQVLVVAVAGVGISACSYDGSDCWSVVDIVGSDITNLFIDTCTQTCYFVDKTTSSVYAVNYMVRSQGAAVPIGSAGAGAVGCTLDYADPSAHLNILYSDCRIERCPITGPFTGCNILRSATGGNCLVMTGTTDDIVTYDNNEKLLSELKVGSGFDRTSTVDVSSVFGMDCSPSSCADDIDNCLSAPCLYGSTCVNLPSGYSCQCLSGFSGNNCQDAPADLIALMEVVEKLGLFLGNNTDFPKKGEYYSDDAIIDYLDFPQLRGKEGFAYVAETQAEIYSKKVPSNLEVRKLCDLCYEFHFKVVSIPIDPEAPRRYDRVLNVFCFDFETLTWLEITLVVTPDPQD